MTTADDAKAVARYKLDRGTDEYAAQMLRRADGSWVKWQDHAALLADLAAAQVAVKPLEWVSDNWYQRVRAKTAIGDYLIWWGYNGEKHSLRFDDRAVTEHLNIEAAKAAAQADYEARIRAALTAVPSPEVAGLVSLLNRAKEELRLIRMKDTGAVYDVLLRTELDAALASLKGGAA